MFFDVVSTQKSEQVRCPHCGAKVHVYDHAAVRLKDMPVYAGIRNTLNVLVHRYRCISCRASFTENIPFRHEGTRITNRLANHIRSFLKHHMSIKDISAITGVHWDTIAHIHKKYMEEELKERTNQLTQEGDRPKYLAVDEFAIHKGHTYATCVMDLETGEVIWVGSGRAISDFRKFFLDLPEDYLSDVRAVAMDMNASYNRLVEENLPHAEIVYDRYHFQAQYGRDVLGAVRLEEARAHREHSAEIRQSITEDMNKEEKAKLRKEAKLESLQYSTLKKSRWTLLANNRNLKNDKKEKLSSILESHSRLATCYAMKEEMIRLYELTDTREAELGWKELVRSSERK